MITMASKATAFRTRTHQPDTFLDDVLAGLLRQQKTLPCKYLYDEYGSYLFDRICELDEYYPTRTEMLIMRQHIDEIAAYIGMHALLVEYGSGSSLKTRLLLDSVPALSGYIPIDISEAHLLQTAAQLEERYDTLPITPLCADYTHDITLPESVSNAARVVAFFPGSTIGNFDPEDARDMLKGIARVCGPDGGLLIGVDLIKEITMLEAAYNDSKGVTAAFNLNLLRRINRELEGTFQLDQFAHMAIYNTTHRRIEMHLVSLTDQVVKVGGHTIFFRQHEIIHTENSYKYSIDDFATLARSAGFEVEHVWTDRKQLFSVQYLVSIAKTPTYLHRMETRRKDIIAST